MARNPRAIGLWGRLLSRPPALLLLTFAGLIVAGTIALQLPQAHRHDSVGLLDALFTATSAVCVTGLITVDTATDYSRFGQTVILILIQLGGLGVMTFGALAAEVLRVHISFSSQAALRDMFFQEQMRGRLRTALLRIVLLTFVVETIGALLMYRGLTAFDQPRGGQFEAVFLAISAFCNAGFSVYSNSVLGLRDSLSIVWVLMALIVLGGLGYPVLQEILARGWRRLRRRAGPVVWSLHARVVLWGSLGLTLAGAAALALTGWTELGSTFGGRLLNSLFQSVTARTAGFNTVPIGALPLPALLMLLPLMFVGGSPGSCAGGIKTTSGAVWIARLWAGLHGRTDVTLFGRRIPYDLIRRAVLVISAAAVWNLAGVTLLAITEAGQPHLRLEALVFEQISAFGTVGLSTGLTPALTPLGKLWIIASMFVGRLGPLTVAFAVMSRPGKVYDYPVERVMIG